ncbi:dual specificity protein kinase kns1 [Aspergillus nanangensis]|uniref:Dual specificity protein kinase kns1 n=1 Tax=Aspergillus nanangensis TaxID=2582783 RepID=A0AAD4GNI4_ASPNN|nr:dual specificity protein kinase kns1 [Aspergillus nanangensis]
MYASAKHGCVGLTRSLAQTAYQAGIRVNCICPGSVSTGLLQQEEWEDFGKGEFTPIGKVVEAVEAFLEDESLYGVAAELIQGRRYFRPPPEHWDPVMKRIIAQEISRNGFQVCVADFSIAEVDNEVHNHLVVTRPYRPPEVILQCPWGLPVDIWSIGCIMIELLLGMRLFTVNDDVVHLALMQKFTRSLYGKPQAPERRPKVPKDLCDRILAIYGMKPEERIREADDLKHSWLEEPQAQKRTLQVPEDLRDLLQRIFVMDPEKRITAADALKHKCFTKLEDNQRLRKSNSTNIPKGDGLLSPPISTTSTPTDPTDKGLRKSNSTPQQLPGPSIPPTTSIPKGLRPKSNISDIDLILNIVAMVLISKRQRQIVTHLIF